jgi:hypothetical protein
MGVSAAERLLADYVHAELADVACEPAPAVTIGDLRALAAISTRCGHPLVQRRRRGAGVA